jgi:1,5-anhydro-D-fructose reductase (1,5-anhydro-D-mannitol-forming)
MPAARRSGVERGHFVALWSGANQREGVMSKTKVAVIGLGVMGRRMITNMSKDGRFEIVAAWDLSEAARGRLAQEFPAIPLAPGPGDITGHSQAELVYIASPPVSHREYALAAAAAGKAIYCEKPLGTSIADSRALVAGLEKAKARHSVNFLQATSHAVALTEERLKAGALGDIAGGDIIVHFTRWPRDWQAEAKWLAYRKEGGYTREVLSHFVYLAKRLLGEPRLVSSQPRFPADPALCERHIVAALDCGSVPVQVLGSSGGAGPDRIEFTIWGSKLSHKLHDWFWLQSSGGGEWKKELPEIEDLRAANFVKLLDDVLAMTRGEPHRLPSAADALKVQEIVEAMLAGC